MKAASLLLLLDNPKWILKMMMKNWIVKKKITILTLKIKRRRIVIKNP